MDTAAQFESIVQEHQQKVFRTLLRLTGNRENVEDLAQEVFLRLYRGLENFRGDALISTYLYRIVLNVAQDEWKRRRKERENIATPVYDPDTEQEDWIENLPQDAPDAEATLEQKEMWQAVDEELLQLGDAERAVLVLYHQEECSYEQIALALKLPVGTVRTHLHRGREKLGKLVRARMRRQASAQRIAVVNTLQKGYSL
ncbi:MAG: RNA polymerase sigma factor [Acidobacteriaceae bacterium]|nr:RNA polymerase sigma factor [Acidobacteriaceae bacterium]